VVWRNIELTRLLERLLAERGFTALPDGELSIACVRVEPPHGDPSLSNRVQEELARRVATGWAWISTVRHGGRTWLRFSL
jgi:glutamate/tyrosine decarboxylase-like PLP-dependent enzyme